VLNVLPVSEERGGVSLPPLLKHWKKKGGDPQLISIPIPTRLGHFIPRKKNDISGGKGGKRESNDIGGFSSAVKGPASKRHLTQSLRGPSPPGLQPREKKEGDKGEGIHMILAPNKSWERRELGIDTVPLPRRFRGGGGGKEAQFCDLF